jgi:esterase/lipase superfamily enzyme
MEVTLFTGLAKVYPTISERTTMYVSARDKALELSKWLQGSDRAGYTPPVTVVPGIDTIEVTDIDLTMLGHSYYAEAEGVLHDIYDLLNFDAPPDLRARTRLASKNPKYWAIAR